MNYNSRWTWFNFIYNLRKNIWNKVNKSSKLYKTFDWYCQRFISGRELVTMQYLLQNLWYLYIFNENCLTQSVNNWPFLIKSFLLTGFFLTHFHMMLQCKNYNSYLECIKVNDANQRCFMNFFSAITWFNNQKQLTLTSKDTSTISFPHFLLFANLISVEVTLNIIALLWSKSTFLVQSYLVGDLLICKYKI